MATLLRLVGRITADGRLRVAQPAALLIGPAMLLIAVLTPFRWLFYLAYVYILLVIVAYAWVRVLGPRIRVRRRLQREWGQVGDTLEEHWELDNSSWLPLLWLEIEDTATLPGYTGRRVVAADPRDHYTWVATATFRRRGAYQLGPFTARIADPLGLFRFEWRDEHTRQVFVYPPLVQLPQLVMPEGQRGGLSRTDQLHRDVTPNVGGLREYVPGDMLSHIHWPTVARMQRLMVKEFDQERAGALWIALDLYAGAYAGISAARHDPGGQLDSPLELAIVLACSLAAQALAMGRQVGLLADDGRQHLITPGLGTQQLWRILNELVDVQATGAHPLGHVLEQGRLARPSETAGAALALVTPVADGSWLAAVAGWLRGRTSGAMALLVTDEQVRAAPHHLIDIGVATYVFPVGAPLQLVNPVRPREHLRTSPLGKVVVTRDSARGASGRAGGA